MPCSLVETNHAEGRMDKSQMVQKKGGSKAAPSGKFPGGDIIRLALGPYPHQRYREADVCQGHGYPLPVPGCLVAAAQ